MKTKLLIVMIAFLSCFAYGQKKGKKSTKVEPGKLENLIDSVSYSLGIDIGEKLKQMGVSDFNLTVFQEALQSGLKGEERKISQEQGMSLMNTYFMSLSEKKNEENKKKGEAFLEANKKNSGVVVTESGLQYIVLKEGDGPKPTQEDKVKVHYHGTLIDGTVFDSSVDRGEPVEFPVTGVIKGWQEVLQLMPVGSKWKVFIPTELAYGTQVRAGGQIEANMALIFDIELLDIVIETNINNDQENEGD